MKQLWLVALAVALISGLYHWQTRVLAEDSGQDSQYRLLKTSCPFQVPWRKTIRCGQLITPQSSGAFHLPFVVIEDDSVEHRTDPLVYLTGGPGVSARLSGDGISDWLHWLEYANLGRDLILMDPRGTGGAKPALLCAAYNRFHWQLFRLNLPLAEELEQDMLTAQHCFDALSQSKTPITPQDFGTELSAQDIRALIALLGKTQWNLLGVSYGTRLALEVARQEGDAGVAAQGLIGPQLRSIVLDSVYPAGEGGVQTWPQVLDDAFARFFSDCNKYPECSGPLKGLSQKTLEQIFFSLLQQLDTSPLQVTVARTDGEAPVTLLVNGHRFLSASFAAIYHPDEWPRITSAIAGALRGRSETLKPLITPYINNSLTPDFNSLAFMAVDCADNPVASAAEYVAAVARYARFADYTRDQWRYQICRSFYPLKPAQGLKLSEPKVPVLMLNGELDPITPVVWARVLHQRWPSMQLLELPGVGHGVLGESPCVLGELRRYLDNPEQQFDVNCAKSNAN